MKKTIKRFAPALALTALIGTGAAAYMAWDSFAGSRGNICRVVVNDNGEKSTVCTRRYGTCDQYDLKTGYCARQAVTVDHREPNSIFQDGKGGSSGND